MNPPRPAPVTASGYGFFTDLALQQRQAEVETNGLYGIWAVGFVVLGIVAFATRGPLVLVKYDKT